MFIFFMLMSSFSCCTTACRFKPGAVCSPKNSPCCSRDCHFLPATLVCLHENVLQCKLSSHCTYVLTITWARELIIICQLPKAAMLSSKDGKSLQWTDVSSINRSSNRCSFSASSTVFQKNLHFLLFRKVLNLIFWTWIEVRHNHNSGERAQMNVGNENLLVIC